MRFEYLSDDWLQMVQAQAQALLDDPQAGKIATFRMTQWLTDRDAGDRWIGFELHIASGVAAIRGLKVPQPEADIVITFPRDLGLALSRIPAGPAFDELVASALADGSLRAAGDPSRSPFPENALHDAIAVRTA